MPGDLNAKVDTLKAHIDQARGQESRAGVKVEVATGEVQAALAALREEYGIEPGEGPALLEKLRTDLAAEAERVRAALERAEASE